MTQPETKALPDRLLDCLREMDEAARVLQEAMIAHDADAIWDAVSRQEHNVVRFNTLRRELQLAQTRPGPKDRLDLAGIEALVRERLARIRIRQRTNRTLANNFLSIIEKMLSSLGRPASNKAGIYGASGSVQQATGPLFVQRKG
ncbi:MAG: flagellar export chaperone FlgN [Kiritimatiellae bacterium]|nr:flagellar export chaperone FlgN [Kiritimatiellia bacterium]